jgi:hypothetical protein
VNHHAVPEVASKRQLIGPLFDGVSVGVFVPLPGEPLHALENGPCDFGRRAVEGGELNVLFLAEVDADQGVESVQQLLQGVDIIDVRLFKPLDPLDDRRVVVHHRDGCVGKTNQLAHSG